FGGAAEAIVEFVFRVHPFWRETFHDRVLGRAGNHEEFVLFAVAATASWRGIFFPCAVAQPEVWAGFFIAIAPTAQATHFIVIVIILAIDDQRFVSCGLRRKHRAQREQQENRLHARRLPK